MKFLAFALAAVVGISEGKKIGSAEVNRRMQNGLVNKSVLMRGAKPYNNVAKRKLEEEEAFEITGEYSIQFNTCTSMSVQSDEVIEDENLLAMAANGDLVLDKDYIVFNVCKTDYCQYYGDDEKMTFIAEVGTYFQAISQYLPTKVNDYCEACEENYDYCYAMSTGATYYPEGYEPEEEEEEAEEEEQSEEGEEGEEGEGEEGEGEDRRKLKRKSRKLANNKEVIKFIDCQMCADYECLDFHTKTSNGYYDEDGEYVEAELDDAMEWLNGFAECAETNAYMDDYQIYSNLMCNAAGTGIEIGLFLDDECTLYTPKIAFKNIMQSADMTYYSMISDVVEFTFTNEGIECYNPEVVWYNEVDYYYEQMEKAQNGEEEEEEEEEDDGEAPEAAEWCQELVQEETAADLYDCSGYAAEEEEEEEEEENEDDAVASYDWYSFELTEEQKDDISSVCAVYTGMAAANNAEVDDYGGYSSYTPRTNYNPEHENLFNYDKGTSKASGGKIFGWILFVALVGGGAAAFLMQKTTGGDKKKPLISTEAEGTMA
jgi:hypothetical protein